MADANMWVPQPSGSVWAAGKEAMQQGTKHALFFQIQLTDIISLHPTRKIGGPQQGKSKIE